MSTDLHVRHQRLLEQQAALAALTQNPVLHGENLEQALQLVTETAARLMHIERVSLWRYTQARSAIRCADLYELSRDRHSAGPELQAERYPAYFQALATSEAIVADDAHADPRTCEFSSSCRSVRHAHNPPRRPFGISCAQRILRSLSSGRYAQKRQSS